jgi:hypothetical protein
MSRKILPSVDPMANDGQVIRDIANALMELLAKFPGSHSQQVRLPRGYEIHAYQQLPHIIRVDLHRLDRQDWFTPGTNGKGEE